MIKKLVVLILFLSSSFLLCCQEDYDITFSHTTGFYDSPFYLKTSCDSCHIQFAYSYNDEFKNLIDSIYIDKTTSILFRLKSKDEFYDLGVRSYFISFHTEFKVISLNISEEFLFDDVLGLYVPGKEAYYDTLVNHWRKANWEYKRERPCNVEVFNENGERIIHQNAGVRIFGGMTSYYPEKSLRIIARDQYGVNRFNAAIFDSDTVDYKHLVIRHSGNDYRTLRFKDAFITSIAAESGLDVQQSSPAHLYVNSEYWGVYNLREKINKHYFRNNYNIPFSGLDILQGFNVVDHGEKTKYLALLSFIKKHDLSVYENYEYVSEVVDTRNFINFWVHQMFYANPDVRGNIRFWMSDSLDGKFRWIVYDTDLGFFKSYHNENMLEVFTSEIKTRWFNPTWSTFLLRELLKNEDFKNDFILQYSIIGNTILSTEYLSERINTFKGLYEKEMLFHFSNRRMFQRHQGSISKWYKSIDDLIYFAKNRPAVTEQNLVETFNLSGKYILRLVIENPQHGVVLLNNNIISDSIFNGYFFTPIEIPIEIRPNIGFYNTGFSNPVVSPSFELDTLFQCDTMSVIVSFKSLGHSNHKVIINEVTFEERNIELFNQELDTINLKNWTLSITHLNPNEIPTTSFILVKDSVFIHPYGYNILFADYDVSCITAIQLFDSNNLLVDSIAFELNPTLSDTIHSFSRTIPFDSLDGELPSWEISRPPTPGNHNIHYSDLLLKQYAENVAFNRKIQIIISTLLALLFLILFVFRHEFFSKDT